MQHFATRAQARTGVAAWIEDYNTNRRHSACQKIPPAAYEAAGGPGGGSLTIPRFSRPPDRPVLGLIKVVPPRA